jgi:hypothetical protein
MLIFNAAEFQSKSWLVCDVVRVLLYLHLVLVAVYVINGSGL